MRNAHGSERRIRATHVFGLTAIMVLLLACVARVEAAVDLLYFRATGFENYVLVEWATAQELDNVGFNLYRAETPDFGQKQKIQHIPSQCFGEYFCGVPYSYTDDNVEAGATYYYWLESVDTSNHGEFYSYDPESGTPGLSPTPTSTSTPTETATSTPTATRTYTPTNLPTTTPTTTPTESPTFTPTSVRSATPTSTLTATPTTALTWTPSPTMTTGGTGEPPTTSVPVTGDVAPSPTPTSQVVGALTDQTESPERSIRLQATSWPPPGVTWATIPISTILLFMSVISLLGVLLLSTALALVRKFGL